MTMYTLAVDSYLDIALYCDTCEGRGRGPLATFHPINGHVELSILEFVKERHEKTEHAGTWKVVEDD